MIVREMVDGQLLCINQTSHALLSQALCRHWGNDEFARPQPYDAVMAAIGQHDCGWHQWEPAPKLRSDGYPMDFIHEDDPLGKVELWRRGVAQAYTQHPYAALLIGRHAVRLYQKYSDDVDEQDVRQEIEAFIAEQAQLLISVRENFTQDARYTAALDDVCIEANRRLLQFGDTASLCLCIPWGESRSIPVCPVDGRSEYITIEMQWDRDQIHLEPWPYDIDQFDVEIHGRLLSRRFFDGLEDYHSALAEAPYQWFTWSVERTV